MLPKLIRTVAAYLAATEIGVVGLAVAASVLSARALPWAIATGIVFCLVRWIAYSRWSVRTSVDWPISLLLLMIPVTLWITPLPEMTRPQVYRLLTGVMLFYAIVNWTIAPARVRWLIRGLMLAGIGLALSAPFIIQWSTMGGGKLPFIPRALYQRFPLLVSDTVNPNVMAGTLVIVLPCPVALLLWGWRGLGWPERLLAVIAILVMAGMLILTQSRGAALALGAALAVMVMLGWRRGWLALLACASAAAIAGRFVDLRFLLEAVATNRTFGGLSNRLEIWSRAVYMIQDYPFTGIGMGAFKEVEDTAYPLFMTPPGIPHAHNLFLQVAVDLGIPGLIAWLATLMLVLAAAWRLYQHGRALHNHFIGALGIGLFGSQVALIVHGLTDAVTWGMVRTAVIVWALWSLTMVATDVYVPRRDRLAEHIESEAQQTIPAQIVVEP